MHQFLAQAHRMTVIQRWNNKPNLQTETVAAHSFLVAVIAWGLAAEAREQGQPIALGEVLKRAIAHDLHEVITGDILAPTKRADPGIAKAVADLEREASEEILALLPAAVRQDLTPYLLDPTDDTAEGRLVATADLFAAFLKSWLEVQLGNTFHADTHRRLRKMLLASPLPGVAGLVKDIELGPRLEWEQPSLANFLYLLVTLLYVKRWNFLPSLAPKSVAAHAHLVALAAWVMAAAENHQHGRGLPVDDILARALLMEAPKAITGDILYHSKVASASMEAGVETVRAQAAQELAASLPDALRHHFQPYMTPLKGQAGKLVDEAALVVAYMEVIMETRLGNSYFHALRHALEDRLQDPFPVAAKLMTAFGRLNGVGGAGS